MARDDSGSISQDEIDALLSGVSPTPADKTKKTDKAEKTKFEEKDNSNAPKKKEKDSAQKVSKDNRDSKRYELDHKIEKHFAKNHKPRNEVLSQAEIDQLLTAISKGESEKEKFPAPFNTRKIKIYDFKRPDRFSKEQLRNISCIFENVSRNATTYFSAKFNCLTHIHVCSVDQLTYEEFIRSIPTPTTLGCALWENQHAVIEVDPVITFEMLNTRYMDKLCDFEDAVEDLEDDFSDEQKDQIIELAHNVFCSSQKNRDLTDEEAAFMKKKVIRPLYKMISESFNDFKNQFPMYKGKVDASDSTPVKKPSKIQIECNPQFAQITTPSEMVVLVTLECGIADEEGMINVCLPYPFVKEILLKRNILMAPNSQKTNFGLEVLPGNSTVSLGQFNVPEGAKIGEGMIIELDKLAGEPVDLVDKASGKVFAKAEVVVIDENFGVRITEVLDKSMELKKEEKKDNKEDKKEEKK